LLDDPLPELEKLFARPFLSDLGKTLREIGPPILEKRTQGEPPSLIEIDISRSLKTRIPLVGAETPQDMVYGVYARPARKMPQRHERGRAGGLSLGPEIASPAFIDAILNAYRMGDFGVSMPRGKIVIKESLSVSR
jgi:hypothetical protein